MSSEPPKAEHEENASSPDREEADGYEFWVEMLVLLFLTPVGIAIYVLSDGWFGKGAGINLFTAGMVGLLVLALYERKVRQRRQRLSQGREQLLKQIYAASKRLEERGDIEPERIQEAIAAGVPEVLSEFHVAREVGLAGFDSERPTKKINQAVLEAEERVDILEVSLKTMRRIDTEKWRDCKAKVRIILLDPMFPEDSRPLALQRDEEEDQKEGVILKEVHDILEALPDEWLDIPESEPSVKLARSMPTLSYFRIDDVAYFSPLVHKQVGDVTMHLRLSKGGEFFKALTENFDKLWTDPKTRAVAPRQIPQEYPETPL